MILVALVNMITGGYLLNDAGIRITSNQQLLIFDEYLSSFARFIPILLGVSMILASFLLLLNKSTAILFYSYVNSFLFLLFYTPSVFYSGIEERYSPWLIVVQFSVLITCTILLYATREKGKGRAGKQAWETYEEYKRSMHRFLNPNNHPGTAGDALPKPSNPPLEGENNGKKKQKPQQSQKPQQ